MSEHELQATMHLLASLAGSWSGGGVARFPTTPTFNYREQLTFTVDEARPLLHYVQRAYKQPIGTSEFVPSHWESGFILLRSATTLEMNNVQSGGRLEVLDGVLHVTAEGFRLELSSKLVANDARVEQTARTIWAHGDTLKYVMSMSTTQVPTLSHHLEAILKKD